MTPGKDKGRPPALHGQAVEGPALPGPGVTHWLITRDVGKGSLGSLGHVCRCEIGADHMAAGAAHRLFFAPDDLGYSCVCLIGADHYTDGELR